MATNYLDRWETAKTKFENVTGVKKPKPKGFFKTFFNYTGLTTALAEVDTTFDVLDKAKPADKPKAAAKAEEKLAKLSRAIADYLKILEKDAKNEQYDNEGTKTQLYRELKVLSSELKSIDATATNYLNSRKIVMDDSIAPDQKAEKIMKAALAAACAYAVAAVKKIQATPTPETFNGLFRRNDSPGRKIQVQLVNARDQLKQGKLSAVQVDPGTVAEKFTPWQSESSANNTLPDDATKDDVLSRLEQFKTLLKLAVAYSGQL